MTEPEKNQTAVEITPTETGGPVRQQSGALATLERLATIPEEELWLQNQRSTHTRRAYKEDVRHFMQMFGITTHEELRASNRAVVIAWTRRMEAEEEKPRTICGDFPRSRLCSNI